VALCAVGAPAEVVFKMLAGHAPALLEHVVRYHILLLYVPMCVWGSRREARVGAEEARRFGGIARVRARHGHGGRGRAVSREGGGIRAVVVAERMTRY
jgi:hypothetical protein